MKVIIINNDFRVYWRSRLLFLKQFLSCRHISLHAIELFGKGSPYTFDNEEHENGSWTCLFPHDSASSLAKKDIKQVLFAALDALQPDVIISSSIVFYAGAIGLRWAKSNRKKFIMFEDVRPRQLKRNPVVKLVKNTLIQQADGLWFPSAHYRGEYAGFHRDNTHFFYGFSCIDNHHFTPAVTNKLNHKTIICVARLVPIKNIDNLLRAWKMVETQAAGYRLLIVGNGSEEEALHALQKELGLSTVEFAGAIDNKELPPYYHRADAFILASLSESWGLVVNEAMAAGLPVLLSTHINAGSILLKDGVNGFSFEPSQVTSISDAILKYIQLSSNDKLAMAGQSLEAISAMNYEMMGQQLVEALHIIHRQKHRPASIWAAAIFKLWYGKYDTAVWDKIT